MKKSDISVFLALVKKYLYYPVYPLNCSTVLELDILYLDTVYH